MQATACPMEAAQSYVSRSNKKNTVQGQGGMIRHYDFHLSRQKSDIRMNYIGLIPLNINIFVRYY